MQSFTYCWLPLAWGETKKKTRKKLSEASCQEIKGRLEMISPPFVDVWLHGYLQDNQE